MFFATDLDTVTHGIQLAVAPVFLLTAVAAMIGTAAGRLARIIDRARLVESKIENHPNNGQIDKAYAELNRLKKRGRLVNLCIALLTFGAISIALTIVTLFIGETTELQIHKVATIAFLIGVGGFVMALLCFFAETLLATSLLRFPILKSPPATPQEK
jgi:MFS family permease